MEVHMKQASSVAMTFGFLVISALSFGCRYDPEPGADLVLINGRVYTLAWGQPSVDGSIAADAPHDANG